MSETGRRSPLPERLAQEQRALGIILSLIARCLAIGVLAVAAYLIYLSWR
ncbi:MAG: hypothetical protein JNL25_01520 [Rhodospirillaceae bacterium]|nr:hypothetical protein [Rhodospirillaceae bacterium]